MEYISYTMGTRDFPDVYARALGPAALGLGHIYQANPSCPWYNYYILPGKVVPLNSLIYQPKWNYTLYIGTSIPYRLWVLEFRHRHFYAKIIIIYYLRKFRSILPKGSQFEVSYLHDKNNLLPCARYSV